MAYFRPPSISRSQWFWLLLLTFVSQHIAVFGSGIPLTVLLVPGLALMFWRRGIAVVDSRLVKVYAATTVVTLISLVINASNPLVSKSSPIYYIFLTAPFILRITAPTAWRLRSATEFWIGYQNFMIFASILGVGQILLGEYFFSFRDLLPEVIRLEGYNTTNAVTYGSSIFRANGFFFYEPSFFSQFVGIALLVEMRTARRYSILLLFAVALMATFSGTGFILLAIGLLALAIERSAASWKMVVATLIPLPIILVVGVYLFPDFFIGRLSEFSEENSSAYIRFVAPFLYVQESYLSSITSLLLGVGPGVAGSLRDADVMADFPGIGKILFEYGLLGGALIMTLYGEFCRKAKMAGWIKWPLLLVQVVLNNGIFTPIAIVFFLLLAVFGQFSVRPRRTPTSRSTSAALVGTHQSGSISGRTP